VPRKGHIAKRDVPPDPVYNSKLVTAMMNKIMLQGRKSLAESTLYNALQMAGEKTGKDPLEVLEQAMKNIMPVLEVKPRRVGGQTYQVPVEVSPDRRLALGLRWLVQTARSRSEKTMVERFAAEIIDASNNVGTTVKKREDTHRMAEANRAFAHYRW
jgi:small subunit ribosomal protein S7